MSGMNQRRGVSVVLCCHDSARYIVSTVSSLCRQAVPPGEEYELVLVDNRCTDDTVERARKAWDDRLGELRVVEESETGLAHARRTGVRAARFDKILFVDDDNILSPRWIEGLCAVFNRNPTVGVMGGYSEPQLPTKGYPDWFLRYQRVYACGPQAPKPGILPFRKKRFLYGAGLGFRAEPIKEVIDGPLPLYLVGRTGMRFLRGDDTEMCLRTVLLGWDIYYDPGLRIRHNLSPERLTWSHVLKMRKGTGASIPILQIYSRLAENRKPPTYRRLLMNLAWEWLRFASRPFALPNLFREGADVAFRYAYLKGMTLSALTLAGRYGRIGKRIESSFGGGGPGSACR